MYNVTCSKCGVEFKVCPSRFNSRKNFFCSKKCEGEYVKEHNENWIPCEVCGKLRYVKPNEQKEIDHITCSYKCRSELLKEIYVGENNPNYRKEGEHNPLYKERNVNSFGYIIIKKEDHPFVNCDGSILEHRYIAEQNLLNDENSIEINGIKYLSPDFVVHHIDGNRKNNDINNLMVLTRGEHTKLHMTKNK